MAVTAEELTRLTDLCLWQDCQLECPRDSDTQRGMRIEERIKETDPMMSPATSTLGSKQGALANAIME
jgi:hypothetical protein